MLKKLYIFFSVVFVYANAQNPCIDQFVNDSIKKPGEKNAVVMNALTYTLKNGGVVQFIKDEGKFYLRLKLREKLGFISDGTLELISAKKSIFFKTTFQDIDTQTPYFILPIGINYVATLKELGLTTLIFNSHEVKFSKDESKGIKETANCFYTINNKK